ncbi:unnamed protein product [Parajaminaea phylloscopi]
MQSNTDIDVVIVGAGLSGINAAYRVQTQTPYKYTVLEARSDLGGTWSLFKYPGIRSDSDMFTLGLPFKPWTANKAIADGDAIYEYIKETAEEFGIDKRIQYNSQVRHAEWSSEERLWKIHRYDTKEDKQTVITAKFVIFCSGYYDYDQGFQPRLPGMDEYQGKWIHPQAWPEDYDYSGKKIVIIGSGATAVTLLPNLAQKAKHVTLLQRSPSYFVSLPNSGSKSILAYLLPTLAFHTLFRFFLAVRSYGFYWFCQAFPRFSRWILRTLTKRELPSRIGIDPHFAPNYNPWDQRLCLVPDGDMFKALRDGNADIATGQIEKITPDGILLKDGQEIAADVVVCATGLNMKFFGGCKLIVDGEKVDINQQYMYRGQFITGIPNMSLCFGYTNASWTMGSDACAQTVTRLLNEMEKRNISSVSAQPPNIPMEKSQPLSPLSSGYFARAHKIMPRSAGKLEGGAWGMKSNWFFDIYWAKYGNLFKHLDVSYAPRTKAA